MHLIGLSDHAVLKVSVSFEKPSDPSDAFIPDAIFKQNVHYFPRTIVLGDELGCLSRPVA